MAGQMSSAVTLEEVAAAAGVSRSTVSRIINGSPAVKDQTREHVLQIIAELGYTPNRAAQSLAGKRARAIALVIPEDTANFFGDPFFASVVSGVESYLRDTDIVLNIMIASNARNHKAASYLVGGNADGALVVSHHTSNTFVEILERRLPVVYAGRPVRGADHRHFVDVDNVQGGRQATEYLVGLGRKKIATITGPIDMPSGQDRLRGYQEVLAAAGMEDIHVEGAYTMASGAAAMRVLLERYPDLDAVFVASDLMARGAVDALTASGRRVPEDVAICGFDDSAAAVSSSPLLTTIRQRSYLQGREAARMLLDRLDGKNTERTIILPTEFIYRESA